MPGAFILTRDHQSINVKVGIRKWTVFGLADSSDGNREAQGGPVDLLCYCVGRLKDTAVVTFCSLVGRVFSKLIESDAVRQSPRRIVLRLAPNNGGVPAALVLLEPGCSKSRPLVTGN